jgi:hypothetical protein
MYAAIAFVMAIARLPANAARTARVVPSDTF